MKDAEPTPKPTRSGARRSRRRPGRGPDHSSEKSLKDYGDKISAEDRQAIETAIADLKTAAEGDDADDIKAKTNTLAKSR